MNTTGILSGFWRRLARAVSLVLITGLLFSGAASAAPRPQRAGPEVAPRVVLPTAPKTVLPATAAQLATAMDIAPADLVTADLKGSGPISSDPNGVGVSDAPLGNYFPRQGSTFAILSTGLASDATRPNSEGNLGTILAGLNNNEGNDLVELHLQLDVPADRNCASVDFAFYSEEFPEYVGSQFNDAFTAQLNNSTISVSHTVSGSVVIAPGNFAVDALGNNISVNTAFGVSSNTGSTYDGVTPLIRASTPVTPGATIDLYFSIQDLGDSVFDSAVFLDHFQWTQDATCHLGTTFAGSIFLPLVRK